MKKNILTYMAVCLAMALTVCTGCSTDAEGVIYTPEAAGYSFASTQMSVEATADDQGVVRVPVYRNTTHGAAAVSLTAAMDEETAGIFTLSSSEITFAEGEGVAYAELSYGNLNNLGATTRYSITLSIPEESSSISAESSIDVLVQRQLTWESIGTGEYHSQLFGQSWPQPVEKAQEGNVYRLPDCIVEGYPMVFSLSDDGQELAGWDIQATGYEDANYGMVYFAAAGMTRTGNVLSFPMQGVIEYNGGWGLLYSGFTETLVLPE